MEQNPFHSSEDASTGESKDNKKSDGFNSARTERAYEAPRVERAVPAAPALERVISLWDRQAEAEHRRTTEEVTGGETGKEDNTETSKDSDKKKDTSKSEPRQRYIPPPAIEVQPLVGEHPEQAEDEEPADGLAVDSEETEQREVRDELPPLPPIAAHEAAASHLKNEYVGTYQPGQSDEEQPDNFVAPAAQAAIPFVPTPAVSSPNAHIWPPQAQALEAAPAAAQEQIDDDDVPAPPQPVAAGGGLPPVRQAAFVANQPPNPNYGFVNPYVHPGVNMGPNYNATPASPNVMPDAAPVMPIEHPLQAYNRDPGARQAAALLGVGLFAEHRGRKNADRRLEKADQRAEKLLEQQSEAMVINQRQMQDRQRQMVDTQERQAAEMQRLRQSNERVVAPPVPPSEQLGQPRYFESAPNAGPGFVGGRGPEAMPPIGSFEKPQTAERQPIPVPNAEQGMAAQAEQGLHLRPHEHVEHSAWHNIVVDERGHEVAGAIRYGEGFQRERQQEIIRDRMGGGSSAQGSGQYQQGQSDLMYPGALPSGMTTPALPQGQPTHADPQHQLEPSNKSTGNLNNPWLWIMAILIIVVFFTAALI